ncbi:MAG: hypothetical protein AAF944_04645 [Bacteroidota bacterium]
MISYLKLDTKAALQDYCKRIAVQQGCELEEAVDQVGQRMKDGTGFARQVASDLNIEEHFQLIPITKAEDAVGRFNYLTCENEIGGRYNRKERKVYWNIDIEDEDILKHVLAHEVKHCGQHLVDDRSFSARTISLLEKEADLFADQYLRENPGSWKSSSSFRSERRADASQKSNPDEVTFNRGAFSYTVDTNLTADEMGYKTVFFIEKDRRTEKTKKLRLTIGPNDYTFSIAGKLFCINA